MVATGAVIVKAHELEHTCRRTPSQAPSRQRTRDLLRVIAERQHTSMNQLAEVMIARELGVLALGLESTLSRTIELL